MNERYFKELYFKILKISLFFNLMIYSITNECPKESPIIKNNDNNCTSIYCSELQFNSGECKINNRIVKTQWLNNIIKFENTNGDINLIKNYNEEKIIFSTTLSNKKERIIFALDFNQNYIFTNGSNHWVAYISKNIGPSLNNEIANGQCLIYKNDNEYLFLISKENSDIQILNLNEYEKDFDYISKYEFLEENKKIKGDYSYCIFNVRSIYHFYFGAITSIEDESPNYNISLYYHQLSIENNKLKFTYTDHIEIDDMKGEYASYFADEGDQYISCFYLNQLNIYNITIFGVSEDYFVKGNTLTLEGPSGSNNEIYFFKGISLGPNIAIYIYYSGENNEIPTFLFKKIDTNFLFSDYLSISNVTLTEYSFNNNINYNELFKKSTKEFYFISTSKKKEILIMANFKIDSNKGKIAIIYYIIELKKYYNMKILQGIKGSIFREYYLSLGFSYFYCLNEACDNPDEENKNSALIIFSYVNKPNIEIDFIDYIFTYNKNHLIIDLAENIKIENNIFGLQIDSINRGLWEYTFLYDESGIEITFLDNGNGTYEDEEYDYYEEDEDYLIQYFYPNNAKINISFANYSFEENFIDLDHNVDLIPPDINEFIEYSDKINNNYGEPENFFQQFLYYHSTDFHYYINIKMDLSLKCNDTNCNLCFINDTDYCILCKGEYDIIFDNYYGKKKICLNNTITDDLTHFTEELKIPQTTIIENIITTEITTIPITSIIITTHITTIPETTYFENIITTELNTIPVTTIITTELNTIPVTNIITTELNTIPLTTIITTELINIPLTIIMNIEISTIPVTSILTTDYTKIPETNNIKNIIITELATAQLTTLENINQAEIVSISEKTYFENIMTTEITTTPVITNFEKIISTHISTSSLSANIYNKSSLFDRYINGEFQNVTISNDEIKTLYKQVKDYLINNYDGNDTLIYTKNVKVQISSIDSKNNLAELSDLDLGKCGDILKEKYSNSKDGSLTILKFDITPENEKSTYVQYEIYNSNTKKFLELNECSENNIVINIPIDLDSDIQVLYDLLSEYGYNLFDSNNSFYNDICATFTTQNNTDILLYDRRMDIYQKTVNISLCQEQCEFEEYNSKTKKAKCNCPAQSHEINTNTSELEFNKNEMINEFYEILKNSNFKVLKCYKLPFNIKIFIKNIGSIIMTILLVIFLILIIYYVTKSSRDISIYIKRILKNKELEKKTGKLENFNDKKSKNKIKNRKSHYFNNLKFQNLNNSNGVLLNNNKSKNLEKKIPKKEKAKKKVKINIKKNQSNDKNCGIKIDYKNTPPRRVNKINLDNFLDSDNKSMINRNNANNNNILISNN